MQASHVRHRVMGTVLIVLYITGLSISSTVRGMKPSRQWSQQLSNSGGRALADKTSLWALHENKQHCTYQSISGSASRSYTHFKETLYTADSWQWLPKLKLALELNKLRTKEDQACQSLRPLAY